MVLSNLQPNYLNYLQLVKNNKIPKSNVAFKVQNYCQEYNLIVQNTTLLSRIQPYCQEYNLIVKNTTKFSKVMQTFCQKYKIIVKSTT